MTLFIIVKCEGISFYWWKTRRQQRIWTADSQSVHTSRNCPVNDGRTDVWVGPWRTYSYEEKLEKHRLSMKERFKHRERLNLWGTIDSV